MTTSDHNQLNRRICWILDRDGDFVSGPYFAQEGRESWEVAYAALKLFEGDKRGETITFDDPFPPFGRRRPASD
ncbi:MAG TPA: hypothetical protein VLI05_01350 [Candidatus Saccharimonadia bacterium]|nr:hypothetical protein [Candidatus Saccharimonadia bacterium]